MWAVAVGGVVVAVDRQHARAMVMPGVLARHDDDRLLAVLGVGAGAVLPMTMKILQLGWPAPD